MSKVVNSWFTRQSAVISGPYTAGLIRRYVLLGRLSQDDEASSDKKEWCRIQDIPDLFPDVMRADLNDPTARERLLAAQRWADERTVKERRAATQDEACGPYQRGNERRSPEAPDLVDYRQTRNERESMRNSSMAIANPKYVALAVFTIIGALVIGRYFSPLPAPDNPPDCAALAAPGINWSNCQFEGKALPSAQLQTANLRSANLTGANLEESNLNMTDLSFALFSLANLSNADLSKATLVGAGFRSANLQNANLSSADLSYADLSGANLDGANLQGAKLDKAIWIDNSVCAPGSVGQCLPAPTAAE